MVLLQQDIRGKLQISHSASTIFIPEKCKTRINVAKSVLTNCDKKNFKNYTANCKHKEDYREINREQYQVLKIPKKNTTVSNAEKSLTTSYVCNEDELFVVLKHALSLDHSYSNIYNPNMNAINKDINHIKPISRSFTFLRERKFPKLGYLQFNNLINQIFH